MKRGGPSLSVVVGNLSFVTGFQKTFYYYVPSIYRYQEVHHGDVFQTDLTNDKTGVYKTDILDRESVRARALLDETLAKTVVKS